MSDENTDFLYRYTNLASTLHILQTRSLTLLNPLNWDDRNDAYLLTRYREVKRAETVLALCFTQAWETYHHWRVFSSGSDGIRIAFHKSRLQEAIDSHNRRDDIKPIIAESVQYAKIHDTTRSELTPDALPFLKRLPYQDEREFRLLYVDCDKKVANYQIPIQLTEISRLTLSPWMAAPLVEAVKTAIRGIGGCEKMRIARSTLVANDQWKAAADRTG